MMSTMRNQMKTILLILVIAFIATIVFNWGMGGFNPGMKPGVIGKVNGQEIFNEDYNNAVENRLNYERQNREQELTDSQIKKIRNDIWNGLVEEILLEQFRKKVGLVVTDKELAYNVRNFPIPYILSSPAFQDSLGNFQMDRYQTFLADPNFRDQVIAIEQSVRSNLERQKVIQRITSGANLSEQEIYEYWERNNHIAEASFVVAELAKTEVESTLVSEDDILSAWKEQKEDFKTEETRPTQYVLFEDKPSSEDTLIARETIDYVSTLLSQGSDFAELAREYSEDGSASEGGSLGWFGRGKMVKEFEEAAFNANKGEIVGPIQTNFGFHLIFVEDKRGSGEEMEILASHVLVKIERGQETLEDIRSLADAFREEAEQNGFEEAARIYNVKLDTLEKVTRNGFLPTIGQNKAFTDFIFNRPVGDISPVYYTRQGFVIGRVIKVIPEGFKPLEEVRQTIWKDLIKEYQYTAAKQKIDDVYSEYMNIKDLEAAAVVNGLELKTTRRPFKIDEFIAGVGRDLAFAMKAMNQEVGQVSEPVKGDKGYYIIRTDSITLPDSSLFESQRDQITAQLKQERMEEVYKTWIDNAKKNTKIEDFRYLYYTNY